MSGRVLERWTGVAFLSASIVGSAGVLADDVPAGPDFLVSVPGNGDHVHTFEAGTWFDFTGFLPDVTFVDFEGLPVGPGDTDTIVQRLGVAEFPFEGVNLWPGDPTPGTETTIDIELVALSLTSIDPVNVGGELFDVFVTQDPVNRSLGEMTLQHQWADSGNSNPEGTFDSVINAFIDVEFVPVGGGAGFQVDIDGLPLESFDSFWSHGLGGGFVVTQILEVHIGRANHPVSPAPGTLGLLAVAGLCGVRRRR